MILLNFLTSSAYQKGAFYNFLTHSHAILVILGITLVPISLTSVFFYASIMPSIWLWLFLLAAAISRVLAPIHPWAIRALDFEQNSIRTLGYLLAALLSFLWFAFLGGTMIYIATIERFIS
jgi:hypothetical protein